VEDKPKNTVPVNEAKCDYLCIEFELEQGRKGHQLKSLIGWEQGGNWDPSSYFYVGLHRNQNT
jgi:hypothetical protein